MCEPVRHGSFNWSHEVTSYETMINQKAANELNIHIPDSVIKAAQKKGRIIK